jgi:hypothetical protein
MTPRQRDLRYAELSGHPYTGNGPWIFFGAVTTYLAVTVLLVITATVIDRIKRARGAAIVSR